MSGGRSFRSLFMVATCASAALGCYLVSLRVASERAALEDVETKIVLAQRDMRVLQTEIGTRGRLAQLERWNASVLAMQAPGADQFLQGSFELAKLTQPQHKVDFQAPVVLASAPAPKAANPAVGQPATDDAGAPTASVPPKALLREASLKTETREVPVQPAAELPPAAGPQPKGKSTEKPATAAKPVPKKSADRPGLAAAQPAKKKAVDKAALAAAKPKKSVDKAAVSAAKAVTRPTRLAKVDPLAPLPDKPKTKTSKDRNTGR